MKKILVIDDDEITRYLLAKVLQKAGYAVVTAEDGEHGMMLLRSECPDAVITDMIMPQGDGVETIIRIRREQPRVRIIAISGGGKFKTAHVLTAAEALGADVVLAKPLQPAELLRCLEYPSPDAIQQPAASRP